MKYVKMVTLSKDQMVDFNIYYKVPEYLPSLIFFSNHFGFPEIQQPIQFTNVMSGLYFVFE